MEGTYKYDVFLSFSSQDSDFVKPIREKLTKCGLKVFFSDEDFKKIIGFEFDDELEKALDQSRHFLLVCTPNAMKSKWVKREYKAFFNEIFDEENEEARRFIILEGKGFTRALLPKMMRTIHTAKSVDDIIKILADKAIPQKGEEIESTFIDPGVPLNAPSVPFNALNRKKNPVRSMIIKGFSIAVALAVLIISIALVINLQKKSQPLEKMPQEDSKKETMDWKSQDKKIYLTHLSFMDIQELSTMRNTEMAALIDAAVVKGMKMGQNANPGLGINAPGHEIPNTDANVNKLINITFDPNLSKVDKITRIINEVMDPHSVDVIVTGHYIDNAQNLLITIRPFLIVKYNKTSIIFKYLLFKKDELTDIDPNSGKKVLTNGAWDEITLAVKQLLEQL